MAHPTTSQQSTSCRRLLWALPALLLSLAWGRQTAAQTQEPAVVVSTRTGRVQGVREGGLSVFRGIRYAQAPVGALRFRPPQPLPASSALVPAVAFGAKAPQGNGQGSEDCLFLNIWTPGAARPLPRRQRRAVVVWVHGGAFTGGSGQDLGMRSFAQQDSIIAVTINYRLGSLGFLYLGQQLGPQYAQAGNCGLLDATAALQWVHDNIAAFGGDPRRVTVMGESAGAKLIGGLLVTPATRGLFQQLILESGAAQAVRDTATAHAVTEQLLRTLHLPPHDVRPLLTLPVDSLLKAQAQFASGAGGLQVFGPVLDGRTIPEAPMHYLAHQPRRRLPRTLLGSNLEEAGAFTGPGSVVHEPNEAALRLVFGRNSRYVWQAYQTFSQTQPPTVAWNRALTDYLYRLATYRLAGKLATQGAPVWLYRFDWHNATQRPFHARELAFVWDETPTLDRQLATTMHHRWATFINTGQPGPDWPAYSPTTRRVMLFDQRSGVQTIDPPYEDAAFPVQGYVR